MKNVSLIFLLCLLSLSKGEAVEKKYISWNSAIELCSQLGEQITCSTFKPDVLVGISRGGLIPVRLLSDILENNYVYVIRISFYAKAGTTFKEPYLVQELPCRLDGKRVLLVDDVADSGRSLVEAISHLRSKGAVEIRTAVLHYKAKSIYKPDFFVKEEISWLVYPWEAHEK